MRETRTLALPHRTQILYAPDIAFISSYLNVVGGSKVVEAGTGSGSFTHSLARNVGPTGKVHSFEFNEERYLKATCVLFLCLGQEEQQLTEAGQ